ncbi:MAG: THUMP domain-containing protein [Candidatus Heimdallarchaeota archaeon]|nr:THUMP domain-containing protein [Candidatus Heimdallarchaeota archaeon]MDH5646753.1 THUMP domain-containing protein [Candidatus Heimdallarchaeota archaeon]
MSKEIRMKLEYGLLISCKKNFESAAASELSFAFTNNFEISKSNFKIKRLGISGLVNAKLNDEIDVIKLIHDIKSLENDKVFFVHCLKFKPLQYIVDSNIDDIAKCVENLIPFEGTYRISVNRRHTSITSKEIITKIANVVPNKVNLENYDFNIVIEIVAELTGISLLKPNDIYTTKKAFESIGDNKDTNWFL